MFRKKKGPPGSFETRLYILDADNQPIHEPDRFKWDKWLGTDPRRILRQDHLHNGVFVSTIFTGLDPRPLFPLSESVPMPPLLWETVVFGGPHDQHSKRYRSKEEAVAGHREAVQLAKGVRTAP